VTGRDKPLIWLKGEIKTPLFTKSARLEAGILQRRLQRGENLGLPQSRPMRTIGPRCHELRIRDESANWRIVYRVDADAIIIAEVFAKKTTQTPATIIEKCKSRFSAYDAIK
jgi:phage-related protein